MQESIKREIEAIIRIAYDTSVDIGHEVEKILKEGWENPMSPPDAVRLLTTTVERLRNAPCLKVDAAVQKSLQGGVESVVRRILQAREQIAKAESKLVLAPPQAAAQEVRPRPYFHGVSVPMLGKDIVVRDIELWDSNHRLETHISQFEDRNKRKPNADELLSIMLSRMDLPGIPDQTRDDQFEILKLAQSIADNGVRRPPIVDTDMTLLDGNRRVAACRYILVSDKFNQEQKRRVEKIYCWQLTPYATEKDREAIIISLNFEDDCKEPWPEYVKARIVYDHWQAMLALENEQTLTGDRQKALKRELAQRFAIDQNKCSRYLSMVEFAAEFEDYHVIEQKRDVYEAKHHADRYFQYFDELTKGRNPGGVYHTLNQNDTLKKMVFDLLFEGKFRNWRVVRWLRYTNEETMGALQRAKDEDVAQAQDTVEEALATAWRRSRENREVGAAAANSRIQNFVEWLEGLPPNAFRDTIRRENLERLHRALELVSPIVRAQMNGGGQ